jgi:triosephosphate isomerase (TIM)
MSRRPLVIGNWKMNGTQASNSELLSGLARSPVFCSALAKGVEAGVCPSAVHVAVLGYGLKHLHQQALANVSLGAQDVSEFAPGAYTGETAASMLNDLGVQFVLVGHSERRSLFGDTNQRVAEKTKAALAANLIPVICVGETLQQREAGHTAAIITEQLSAIWPIVSGCQANAYVIAYEPVWAIGTGKTASPEQAQEVHAHIRNLLTQFAPAASANVRLLYGGSVKAANAAELFAQADIDGGLIGGASLVAADFAAIVGAAVGRLPSFKS